MSLLYEHLCTPLYVRIEVPLRNFRRSHNIIMMVMDDALKKWRRCRRWFHRKKNHLMSQKMGKMCYFEVTVEQMGIRFELKNFEEGNGFSSWWFWKKQHVWRIFPIFWAMVTVCLSNAHHGSILEIWMSTMLKLKFWVGKNDPSRECRVLHKWYSLLLNR